MYSIGDIVIFRDYYSRKKLCGKVTACNNVHCYIKIKRYEKHCWMTDRVGIPINNVIKCCKPFKPFKKIKK